MPTIVELVSPSDSITFYPTPDINGWVYDNATLDAWYALPDVDVSTNKRPNAHGAYNLGQIFATEAKPVIVGQRYDVNPASALAARQRLSTFFADGKPIVMRVTDELGTTSRVVWVVDYDAPFRYGFDHFPFDLAMVAPDPRRYGPATSSSVGMPSSGSGLVWNLGTAPSGLYFDWGTEGVSGQVAYVNAGVAATAPRIEVSGGFGAGFRITEIETGRELIFTRITSPLDTVVLDSRTQRATLNGGDVSRFLTSRKWFSIPPGATYRYQITPLGSTSGAPTMTIYAAAAYM